MIRPPRRAVTRFLIPFIDVLILLFCIFLLMPFVSRPDSSSEDVNPEAGTDNERDKLKFELESARRQVETMKKQLENPISGLQIQVLEIDQANGRLFVTNTESGQRNEIASAGQALRFIAASRTQARPRDAAFLLHFPRELTGFPLKQQVDAYQSWFRGTPFAIAAAYSNPAP